ncbi:hypothetical protein R5R35_012578 [Gryllus longicercus]|uniref:Uncharacterized protein n=1 Tax=Gryllus longicercus TaxID=2509291 RepID=A0AAN9VN37_9ORTH
MATGRVELSAMAIESQIHSLWETLQATTTSLAACDRLMQEYHERRSKNASTQTEFIHSGGRPHVCPHCSTPILPLPVVPEVDQSRERIHQPTPKRNEGGDVGPILEPIVGRKSMYCCGCEEISDSREKSEDVDSMPPGHHLLEDKGHVREVMGKAEAKETNMFRKSKESEKFSASRRDCATSPFFFELSKPVGISSSCPSFRGLARSASVRRLSDQHYQHISEDARATAGTQIHLPGDKKTMNIVTSPPSNVREKQDQNEDAALISKFPKGDSPQLEKPLCSDTSVSSIVLDSPRESSRSVNESPSAGAKTKGGVKRWLKKNAAVLRGTKRTGSRTDSRDESRESESFQPRALLEEVRAAVREEFQLREDGKQPQQESSAANALNSTLEVLCRDLDSHLRVSWRTISTF